MIQTHGCLLKHLLAKGTAVPFPFDVSAILQRTSSGSTRGGNISLWNSRGKASGATFEVSLPSWGLSPLSLPSQNLLKEEIQHHIYQGAFSIVPASLEPSLILATDFPETKLPKSLADETLWNVDDGEGWHWRTNSYRTTPREGNAGYPFLDISGGSQYLLWSPSF